MPRSHSVCANEPWWRGIKSAFWFNTTVKPCPLNAARYKSSSGNGSCQFYHMKIMWRTPVRPIKTYHHMQLRFYAFEPRMWVEVCVKLLESIWGTFARHYFRNGLTPSTLEICYIWGTFARQLFRIGLSPSTLEICYIINVSRYDRSIIRYKSIHINEYGLWAGVFNEQALISFFYTSFSGISCIPSLQHWKHVAIFM